ncbi:putative reverse transcriptase domain-containing protein, partial [Tanacetum coccineum]
AFLGHIVVVDGITMDLAKVKAITEWPRPMKKREKFVWNEEREKSFEEVKRILVSSPVLTLPSRTGGYQIYSNASKKVLVACLRNMIKEAHKDDGELWVVLQNLNEVVLIDAYNSPFSTHPGSTKMYGDLKQNFWWNGMKHDVARFVVKLSNLYASFFSL